VVEILVGEIYLSISWWVRLAKAFVEKA